MCRLKLKIRIIGKKNQSFIRFILVEKTIKQKGKYFETLGYWDVRQNINIRVMQMNLYKLMSFNFFGATLTKTTLPYVYYWFCNYQQLESGFYFSNSQLKLFVQNEIKLKYQFS